MALLQSRNASMYNAQMPNHGEVLARALAALRERAGMQQAEAAKKVGVARSQLSRWENGAPMKLPNLFALLDLYGATLADLGDATRNGNTPGRSRYHHIAEQTGREQDLRIAELEAKVRRLQLDVDDLVSTRSEGGP